MSALQPNPSRFRSRPISCLARTSLLACCLTAVAALAGCSGGGQAAKPTPGDARVYAFWPPPPAEPHIQYLRSFSSSADISGKQQSGLDKLVFGDEKDRAADINKPYGIASKNGRLYICDIRNTGLMALDLAKNQTRLIGTVGQYKLVQPVDVDIADDGMIYVADTRRGIVVYDPNERYVGAFSREKFEPIGVAVFGNRIYVCNRASQVVEVLNRADGTLVSTIGTVGDEDGQFRLPLGIATDSQGNIHVVDFMRCRLQKFSPDGKFLIGTGSASDTAGNFVKPKHITIDREQNIYVVDAAFQNVQIFDKDYKLLTSFGGGGRHLGAMDLPAGIAIFDGDPALFSKQIHPFFDGQLVVLVTNQFAANKVSAYSIGQLKSGHTGKELAASLVPVPVDTPEAKPNPLSGLENQPLDQTPAPDAPQATPETTPPAATPPAAQPKQ